MPHLLGEARLGEVVRDLLEGEVGRKVEELGKEVVGVVVTEV